MNRSAALYRYRIPLKPAITLAGRTLTERQGWLLLLKENGHSGYGEASPLPGFSQETLNQAQHDLVQLTESWIDQRPLAAVCSASARFAFSCACHELEHGSLQAPPQTDSYPLLSEPGQITNQPIAKLKLGRRSLDQEIDWVKHLIKANPGIQLRIDCNQSWTLSQGRQFLESIPTQAIDYLEEPCTDLTASLRLTDEYPIGLALDESLRQTGFKLSQQRQLKALILKPSLTGSLNELHHWLRLGQQQGVQTVLSSSYETSLGLGQLAALAQQLTPEQPPGLDTAASFSTNLLRGGDASKPTLSLEQLECLWQHHSAH